MTMEKDSGADKENEPNGKSRLGRARAGVERETLKSKALQWMAYVF